MRLRSRVDCFLSRRLHLYFGNFEEFSLILLPLRHGFEFIPDFQRYMSPVVRHLPDWKIAELRVRVDD